MNEEALDQAVVSSKLEKQGVSFTYERGAGRTITLSVSMSADEVDRAYAKAIKEVSSEISLPGFRKGKVPHSLLENRFSAEIMKEWLNHLVRSSLNVIYDLLDTQLIHSTISINPSSAPVKGHSYAFEIQAEEVLPKVIFDAENFHPDFSSILLEEVREEELQETIDSVYSLFIEKKEEESEKVLSEESSPSTTEETVVDQNEKEASEEQPEEEKKEEESEKVLSEESPPSATEETVVDQNEKEASEEQPEEEKKEKDSLKAEDFHEFANNLLKEKKILEYKNKCIDLIYKELLEKNNFEFPASLLKDIEEKDKEQIEKNTRIEYIMRSIAETCPQMIPMQLLQQEIHQYAQSIQRRYPSIPEQKMQQLISNRLPFILFSVFCDSVIMRSSNKTVDERVRNPVHLCSDSCSDPSHHHEGHHTTT